MEITKDGGMIYATVIGISGKKYPFRGFDVSTYPDDTHVHMSNDMTVYIFFKDIDKEKPTLLDIGSRDNWAILYKNMNKFKFLKENNVTHFMYYELETNENAYKIRWDILDGNTFDQSNFKES